MEAQGMRTPLKVERVGAVAELTAGLKKEKRSVNQVRLRAVLAVARGGHVPAVSQTFSVGERAARNWVHAYNESGLEGLADKRAGRVCRLSVENQARLQERIRSGSLETDGVCSLRGQDILRILQEEFDVAYAESSVYYLLHHQLGFSYLKPRPLHRKTDPAVQEAFKKSSRKRSKTSGRNTPRNGSRSGSRTKAASGNKGR